MFCIWTGHSTTCEAGASYLLNQFNTGHFSGAPNPPSFQIACASGGRGIAGGLWRPRCLSRDWGEPDDRRGSNNISRQNPDDLIFVLVGDQVVEIVQGDVNRFRLRVA